MIKKVSIITIIAVVVASLAIVAIAKYQRLVQPAIARGLAGATDAAPANLDTDKLIAAAEATAASEFAKGNWINSDRASLAFILRGRLNYRLNPKSHPAFHYEIEGCPPLEHACLKGFIRSYESLRHRSDSQPCGHWTRRRREDATG